MKAIKVKQVKYSPNSYESGILTGKELQDALRVAAETIIKIWTLGTASLGNITAQDLTKETYMLNVGVVIDLSKETKPSTKKKPLPNPPKI